MEVFLGCLKLADTLFKLFTEVSDGFFGDDFLRNRNGEFGAFAVFAFNTYFAAHHVKEASGNRKAKACAFNRAVILHVDSFKFSEEF